MKEYSVYVRNGSASPYRLKSYKNYQDAKNALYEIANFEEERERPFYIDNDFHENKYSLAIKIKYLRLDVREVEEWIPYSYKEQIKELDNKILNINEYKLKSM